jgi:hypothetical protein
MNFRNNAAYVPNAQDKIQLFPILLINFIGLAAELVEMVHEVSQGFHPGYRRVHAQGRYYAAIFKATPEAKKLSRAVLLSYYRHYIQENTVDCFNNHHKDSCCLNIITGDLSYIFSPPTIPAPLQILLQRHLVLALVPLIHNKHHQVPVLHYQLSVDILVYWV